MKVRNTDHEADKIELQMTPMIDIVFQLLVFFIMLFKIVQVEGDFNIKMPTSAPREGDPDPDQLPPMKLRMYANPDGDLVRMRLNETSMGTDFTKLRLRINEILGTNRDANSIQSTAEIELDCDPQLRYEYVVEAITSVSGMRDAKTDEVLKLIENIKFAPRKKRPE